MLSKLFSKLKIRKNIQGKDWYNDPRLLQSGVGCAINYNR